MSEMDDALRIAALGAARPFSHFNRCKKCTG
jgi:hypothetical protein